MKLLYWVFAGTLIVAAVLFALSNRHAVEFGFWPLPYMAEVPAYGFGLAAFGLGFLCGGFFLWLRGIGARVRARTATRQGERLQRQIESLREQLNEAKADTMNSGAIVAIADPPKTLQKIAGAR
jgi:uncharacterized integral membrane protein